MTSAPRAIFISALCALLLKTIFSLSLPPVHHRGGTKKRKSPSLMSYRTTFPFPNYENWFPLPTVFSGTATRELLLSAHKQHTTFTLSPTALMATRGRASALGKLAESSRPTAAGSERQALQLCFKTLGLKLRNHILGTQTTF